MTGHSVIPTSDRLADERPVRATPSGSGAAGYRRLVAQELVDERYGHAALTHGGCDALDRAVAHVATGEDARDAGLEQVRVAADGGTGLDRHVWSGLHVAMAVEHDLGRQPGGLGIGADEDEQAC